MSVVIPSNVRLVPKDHLSMDWIGKQFVMQGDSYFHGAVIAYEGYDSFSGQDVQVPVVFGPEGSAYIFFTAKGDFRSLDAVMTVVRTMASENAPAIEETGFPSKTYDEVPNAFKIVDNFEWSGEFDSSSYPFSAEDLDDIIARVEDLSYYTRYE